MGSYSVRDQSIVQQLERAQKDILAYKNAQLFGGDVGKPKITQRRNSDGTPTDWDLMGVRDAPAETWRFQTAVKFIANSQTEPYAYIYMRVTSKANGDPVSQYGGASAVIRAASLGVDGEVIYDAYGSDSYWQDASIDRIYVKFYFYATDYGTMEIIPTVGTIIPTS